MPHIHLETTSDVVENQDVIDMLEHLAAKLSTFETIAPETVKSYYTIRSNWVTGANAPHGFIHCEVAILSGRPPELVQQITDEMFEELKSLFSRSIESGEAGLTLEVREMAKETYRKLLPITKNP
jgi:5-carboxymethyl-2-hydroxymuconate isomerase